MKKHSRKIFVIFLVFAAMAAGGIFHWLATRGTESTDDASIEAHVIPISSKIAGNVVTLNVADNQMVQKGDILLTVDSRDYILGIQYQEADLAAAQARLTAAQHNKASTSVTAPSNLVAAQAQLASAQAEWKNAQSTLKRLQSLNDAARSRQSLDNAIAVEKSARSKVDDAQARVNSAQTAPEEIAASEANVQELQADVQKSLSALQGMRNKLADTVIRAPEAGRVTRRTAELGAYVQAGQQLLSVVGKDVWVVANFKETQLEGMKKGQPVDIVIDAYAHKKFKGTVDSVQAGAGGRFSLFPPENATGNFVKVVQRVPVKINFTETPPDEYAIGPGMSVVPTVHIQ